MQQEKAAGLIEAVRNMSEQEAELLEVFLAGLRAGKRAAGQEQETPPAASERDKRRSGRAARGGPAGL